MKDSRLDKEVQRQKTEQALHLDPVATASSPMAHQPCRAKGLIWERLSLVVCIQSLAKYIDDIYFQIKST